MYKLILLVIAFISSSLSYAQTDNAIKTNELDQKLERLQKQNLQYAQRITELESALFLMKTELQTNKEAVQSEMKKSLELQAQNERAMNIALDQFAEKFEQQNKLVDGVKEEMAKKFADQLVVSVSALFVLLVAFVILNKAATKRALKQNVANWNSFQEHILKK